MHRYLSRRPSAGLVLLAAAIVLAACGSNTSSSADDQVGAATTAATATAEPAPAEPTSAPTEPATTDAGAPSSDDTLFPDVLEATASAGDDGTWTIATTLSSPYDTPERYADAWRVLGPDGTEYGVRVLTHDHADEQPFTRSMSGIEIPDDVTQVTIEGRDQVSGWGGATVTIDLTR